MNKICPACYGNNGYMPCAYPSENKDGCLAVVAREKLKDFLFPDELMLSAGTWLEDVDLENGRYINNCGVCQMEFIGHKRRPYCKKCSDKGLDQEEHY